MQIEYISFSAHVDYNQNKQFIKSVMPDNIILVHGEKTNMRRLKEGLEMDMRRNLWSTTHLPNIQTPEVGQKVVIPFRRIVVAEVVGSTAVTVLNSLSSAIASSSSSSAMQTAQQQPSSLPSDVIMPLPESLLLVTEHFSSKVVSVNDLPHFSSCKFSNIIQRIIIPVPKSSAKMLFPTATGGESSSISVLCSYMEDVFDVIEPMVDRVGIVLHKIVSVSLGYDSKTPTGRTSAVNSSVSDDNTPNHIAIEWNSSPISDTVADSAAGIIMQMLSTPNVLRCSLAATVGIKRASV
jgi:hypothetical protein